VIEIGDIVLWYAPGNRADPLPAVVVRVLQRWEGGELRLRVLGERAAEDKTVDAHRLGLPVTNGGWTLRDRDIG